LLVAGEDIHGGPNPSSGDGPKLCKRRSNNPSLKRPGIPVAPE